MVKNCRTKEAKSIEFGITLVRFSRNPAMKLEKLCVCLMLATALLSTWLNEIQT